MTGIIFSKSAVLFYLFGLLTELTTKYRRTTAEKKESNLIMPWAELCGTSCLVFLVFYSVETVWWAFIALVIGYILILKLLHLAVPLNSDRKKYLVAINYPSRIILLAVIILMFALVNR